MACWNFIRYVQTEYVSLKTNDTQKIRNLRYQCETKPIYVQPLYYKLLIMCQKNTDMKTVIHKKETEVRKERWPFRPTRILYLSSEIICSELPAPQKPFMALTAGVSS